jgi:RNA polymerase primary sigma factor
MLPKAKKISNEETVSLIADYQKTGNLESRDKVVLGNVGLIFSLAHKYKNISLSQSFDDFVSEGILGIMDAIDKFDLSRNNNFSTYAYWRILKNINGSISVGTLGLPQHRINLYRSYEKLKREIINAGDMPDIESMAETLNVSTKILIDTINQKDDISLQFSVEETPVFNNIAASGSFEDDMNIKIDFERAQNIINKFLSKQEQDILNYRFGLNDHDTLTLNEIADKMNMSGEYVRILQNKSIEKIRKKMRVKVA